MFKKVTISLLLLLTSMFVGYSQTVLSAGDIAIIAYNSDGTDDFSFVLLAPVTNTTVIKFAESGWLSAGGFRGGGSGSEGTITWTANANLPCGTEVAITSTGTTASSGTTTVSGSWALSASGDQILAYQGTSAAPTFIYALNNDGAGVWQANATSTNNSAIPTGLTNGTNAVAINEADDVKYDCSTTTPPAAILAAVSNNANWITNNTSAYAVPINCGFTCVACVADPEPTINSSSLSFPSISCNSLTLNWTAGNGANRIVVASTSPIASSPTDQNAYTANSIFGSGSTIAAGEFVVYNGAGTSVSVTGLTNTTTYYFAIFEYNGTVANCEENYFLTTVLTGNATTASPTEPAVNASAYSFSNIGCNGVTISWTSPVANDSSLVVMRAGSDVTTDPIDGTSYAPNSIFGSGADIGTSEFVVYNGSNTSVTVTGLTASTTYFINVFEYNGSTVCMNYRTSDEVSSSFSTVACDTCAHLTSALINSCDNAPCTEGDNEMLFFNSGNYYVTPNAASITINYGSSSPAPNTYADSFTPNSNAIDSMNADPGCTGVYIDATTVTSIPPNSTFLLLNNTVCADAFDWSTMCAAASGNIYVLFSGDATWTSAGQFSNSPPAAGRFYRTIFEGCAMDYKYDNTLPSGDGAIAFWDETGGDAYAYDTNGCALPATILPIILINFEGQSLTNHTNLLKWITSAEINNDYFTLEKSNNAFDFKPIGIVNGAGNNNTQLYYNFIDDSPYLGVNYYRLKQTDFNGAYSYSSIISLKNNNTQVFVSNNTLNLRTEELTISNIDIIDVTGKTVYQSSVIGSKKINLSQLSKGIYIYKIRENNRFVSEKFIIK
jgi:Secretion system C-terminal sorting domain